MRGRDSVTSGTYKLQTATSGALSFFVQAYRYSTIDKLQTTMTNEAQCGRLLQLFSGIELLASVDIHTYIQIYIAPKS